MTAAKTGAARKAASESTKKPVSIKFLGETLNGPATLPGTFALDLLEAGGGNDAGMLLLYKSVLGDSQWAKVRGIMAKKNPADGGFGLLDQLLTAILDAYGISLGE